MKTARRFLWIVLFAPTALVAAATTKIEVAPVETVPSAPMVLPALWTPLNAPLIAPSAAPPVDPFASPVQTAVPFAAPTIQTAAQGPSGEAAATRDAGSRIDTGAFLFDGDSTDKSSLTETAGPPDIIPEWPGRTGDAVRVAGRTYVIGERQGEVLQANGHGEFEGTNPVYRVKDQPLVVKFIHPAFKEVKLHGGEKDALIEMDKTPIAHSRLKAASADGLVLVKELVSGVPLYRVTEAGPLSLEQRAALLDMAVLYVSLGRTADLSQTNLVWQPQARRWVLIDSGGFDFAHPWAPLGQILSRRGSLGIDGVGFLAALRKRLGPDSPAWRAVETSAQAPAHKALLEGLRVRRTAVPQ